MKLKPPQIIEAVIYKIKFNFLSVLSLGLLSFFSHTSTVEVSNVRGGLEGTKSLLEICAESN